MGSILKNFYALQRFGNSLFTYNCVSCKKAIRGNCLCEECSEKLVPAENGRKNFSFAYVYDGPARDALLRYKFHGDYEFCSDTLCDWLTEGFSAFSGEKIDAVVPVPSYKRKSTRLTELVKKFCVTADLPYRPKLLRKTRKTKKQHDIYYKERFTNLTDAFEADSAVLGKTILLVDDIYTTGFTASECSKALYSKGAEKVLVLAVFKTEE